MQINEQHIASIVEKVLEQFKETGALSGIKPVDSLGIFSDIDDAVKAAAEAQRKLAKLTLEERGKFITAIREVSIARAEEWAILARESTGMGRATDKKVKNINAARLTPGIEDLKPVASTGDNGMVIVERAPYGGCSFYF